MNSGEEWESRYSSRTGLLYGPNQSFLFIVPTIVDFSDVFHFLRPFLGPLTPVFLNSFGEDIPLDRDKGLPAIGPFKNSSIFSETLAK